MNEPIISPVAIYIITTLCGLRTFFLSVGGCCIGAGCIAIFVGLVEEMNLMNIIKRMFIIGIPVLFLGFLLPSQETAALMVASAYATPANIEATGNSVKGLIDYVATLFQ